MKIRLLLIAILTITVCELKAQMQWNQLGADIDGLTSSDFAGSSVSMSADGLTVALGAYLGNYTEVYKYISGVWVRQGGTIYGEATGDRSGYAVSLSADGLTVAIGAPRNVGTIGSETGHVRVYKLIGGVWTQLGSDLNGNQLNNNFGHSVGLSADGLTLVAGAAVVSGIASPGYAKVFKYIGGAWVQQTQINGLASNDRGGYSVSISDDGSTIAIGAIGHDANGLFSGQVRVFQNTSGSTWVQKGLGINGESAGDASGESVSLSADGSIVAIGATDNDAGGSVSVNRGHTRIFEFVGSVWTKMGNDINGESPGDHAGKSVSLSDDGLTVAIGADDNNGNGMLSGHARVYRFTSGSWSKVGLDIDGESSFDNSGWSVSLSSDGLTLSVGAIGNDGNGSASGHVKVYSYSLPQANNFCTSTITVFPYYEDFENFGSCSTSSGASCTLKNGWFNEQVDDLDWTTTDGPTPSSSTGPTVDFNLGNSNGNYLYIEATTPGVGFPFKEAIATTPCFDLTSVTNTELIFAYHMFGSTMGTLNVEVSLDSGATYTNVWTLAGNQGNSWFQDTIELSTYDGQTIKIRFRGITGSNYFSDMAIDAVRVQEGCPSGPTVADSSRCGSGTVQLSATPSPGGTSCKWYATPTGGTPINTGNTFTTPSLLTTTAYYVSTYNATCESDTRTPAVATIIQIPTTPTISASASTILCDGDSVMLSSSSAPSYQWSLDGNPMNGATGQTISVADSGDYTVTVANSGCPSAPSAATSVEVLPPSAMGTDVQSACVSYLWIDGNTYTASNNTATFVIPGGALNGCDSNVTLDLTIIQPATSNDTHQACGSFTWIDGITYTASNNNATYILSGAASNGCDSIITLDLLLTPDNTAPIPDITNLADITSACEVTSLTDPTATDNCAGSVIVSNDATLPITTQGTTVVAWTFDDGHGNTTSQTQNIVINDLSAPIPTIASLADVISECEIMTLTAPQATDNCAGAITGTHNATFPITSALTITWFYDDGNGNTSSQTQNVIVDDLTAPTPDITNLADITSECEVTNLTDPTATDNCSGLVIVTNDAILPITAQGTVVVTWTYDDGNGNTSSQAQNIVIDDQTGPAADIANLTDIISECEVTNLTDPTATDNCAGLVTVSNDAILPITAQGTTVVTWTYADGNGNTSNQTQNVIVDDITPPTPDTATLANITSVCEVLNLTDPTATDNCAGLVTVTNDATLPITAQGTTVVTWTYNDSNGNSSIQTQNVVISPIDNGVTVIDPITLSADAIGYFYQWVDCNNGNAPITGETNQTFIASGNGSYAVIIDNGNCSVTSNCVDITAVGLDILEIQTINVFPNPTSKTVTINSSAQFNAVEVVNMIGKVEFSATLDDVSTYQVALPKANGVYFVKVSGDIGTTIFRVIKN